MNTTKRARASAPKANGNPPPAEAAPARINAAGLVHYADAQAVEALPIHYFADRSRWYGPNGQSGFSLLSASQAASLIAEHGGATNRSPGCERESGRDDGLPAGTQAAPGRAHARSGEEERVLAREGDGRFADDAVALEPECA